MFENRIVLGILVGSAKFVCRVQQRDEMYIGYSVKMAIELRAKEIRYLEGVQRSLLHMGVESFIRAKESKNRPRPILTIRGKGIETILEKLPPYYTNPDNSLKSFRQILNIVKLNKHKTDEGLEEILMIKGVLDGPNLSE